MPNLKHQRRGAIVPLFAIIAPVLLIFCAMAINLAHVQLSQTEMQIAVDAAVHAGGRRLGTPVLNSDGSVQTLEEAQADVKDFAGEIAALNLVDGRPANIPESIMKFGRSARETRDDGSFTPFEFVQISAGQIPSSFQIIAKDISIRHAFGPFTSSDGFRPSETFNVTAESVSTQVDRDVVLVLDRSGSMIFYEDEDLLEDTLEAISEETYTIPGDTIPEYRVQFRGRFISNGNFSNWINSSAFSYATEAEFGTIVPETAPPSPNIAGIVDLLEYRLDFTNDRLRSEPDRVEEKITEDEYNDADESLYRRWYTNNVVYWLEEKENPNHTLGDEPRSWSDGLTVEQQRAKLTGHMALYAHDYSNRYRLNDPNIRFDENIESRRAPAFSRWYHLDRGVTVFLNVLGGGVDPDGAVSRDGTVQREQIAILPFNASPDNTNIIFNGVNYFDNNPEFDYGLQDDGFPSAFVNNSNEPGYDQPYSGTSLSLRDILPTICPYGGTAIGNSLREGVTLIRNPSTANPDGRSRPFAAKTIVVLTDGDNTVGDDPVGVARDELANEDVIVHTITFTPGVSQAGRNAMDDVAESGRGNHYHTDSGAGLSTIFEEIANNLPTIITQ